MSEVENDAQTELSKLKVPDLKKMLKARGLSIAGNKQELIERLQSSEEAAEALLEGSEVGDIIDEELDRELDETPLDDEPSKEDGGKKADKPLEPTKDTGKAEEVTTSEQVKPSEHKADDKVNGTTAEGVQHKHKRITITDISASDLNSRKKARLERFSASGTITGKPEAAIDALAKRAERFSADSKPVAKIVNDPLTNKAKVDAPAKVDSGNLLKMRAERFGILSPADQKKQQLEKLQARKARFSSSSPPTATAATEKTSAPLLPAIKTATSVEEKKRLRAERFKIKV